MKYKILGKTGLKVTQFGFGAVQICRVREDDAIGLIRASVGAGINLIDAAHDYPNCEELLGKDLKGIRDKVILCTKYAKTDRKDLLDQLETSFKRLNTDYIDIFLFHGTSKDEELDSIINNGLIEAILKEKENNGGDERTCSFVSLSLAYVNADSLAGTQSVFSSPTKHGSTMFLTVIT